MSPPETKATEATEGRGLLAALGSGTLIAVLIGGLVGALLVYGAVRDSRFAGRGDARIGIRINGLDERIGRDVLRHNIGELLHHSSGELLRRSLRHSSAGHSDDLQQCRLHGDGALYSAVRI